MTIRHRDCGDEHRETQLETLDDEDLKESRGGNTRVVIGDMRAPRHAGGKGQIRILPGDM